MEVKRSEQEAFSGKKGFFTTTLKAFAAWVQENAVTTVPVATGCCSCFNQLRQSGAEIVFNPRHADVLVVSGALSNKAAFVLRRIYDQMPSPKYVVAMGACAVNKGLFADSYAVADVADIVPVDVYIQGCPPDANDVAEGMRALRNIICERTKRA